MYLLTINLPNINKVAMSLYDIKERAPCLNCILLYWTEQWTLVSLNIIIIIVTLPL